MSGEAEECFAAEAGGAACYEDYFAFQGGDCGGVEGDRHFEDMYGGLLAGQGDGAVVDGKLTLTARRQY